MKATNKNLSIETLRGLAILLVVVGHVIGSTPGGGMQIDFPHPLRYLYLWIDYIQMPLFTAIAGWVYALKPWEAHSDFTAFLRKKALRLLLPMAVVATLYFLVQYFMPGTNQKGNLAQLWRIYVFPYTIYWYLPSLFLIFLIQWGIDRCRLMKSAGSWGVCLVVAWLLCWAEHFVIPMEVPNLFSFKGALNQLPYFVLGVGVLRFKSGLYTLGLRWGYAVLMLTGILLLQVEWFRPLGGVWWYELLQPLWVFATLLLLLNVQRHNRFLVWVGGYAYSIYLFHGFGTSGGRILLKWVGVKSLGLIFTGSTLIATLCPVLLDKLCTPFKVLRMGLLGKR